MPKEFELSRRKALAALGTVGAASAGAGLGTSAFFSDQETFQNNQLTAGELDMKVSWEEHYSDWSEDEAEHAHMEEGELVIDDHDGFIDATLQEQFPDKETRNELDEGVADPCDVLADVPDDLEKPVIELSDIKPGDVGGITFDLALCTNPGYLWMIGGLVDENENGVTEPEIDDPDEGDGVELADRIKAEIEYNQGCNSLLLGDGTTCLEQRTLRNPVERDMCKYSIVTDPKNLAKPCQPTDDDGNSITEFWLECPDDDCPLVKDKADETATLWFYNDEAETACVMTIKLEEKCKTVKKQEVWRTTQNWIPTEDQTECLERRELDEADERKVCQYTIENLEDLTTHCEQAIDQTSLFYLECEDDGSCPLIENENESTFIQFFAPETQTACRVEIKLTQDCEKVTTKDIWRTTEKWGPTTLAFGSLREVLEVLSRDNGIPLDGNLRTPFDEVIGGVLADGADSNRECFPAAPDRHCIDFKWELPVDHANEIQTDSVKFDLGFYTEQCRHNDGSGLNNEEVNAGL